MENEPKKLKFEYFFNQRANFFQKDLYLRARCDIIFAYLFIIAIFASFGVSYASSILLVYGVRALP